MFRLRPNYCELVNGGFLIVRRGNLELPKDNFEKSVLYTWYTEYLKQPPDKECVKFSRKKRADNMLSDKETTSCYQLITLKGIS
jgi:hypothetical protein